MTEQENILRLAREAGYPIEMASIGGGLMIGPHGMRHLEKFAALVKAEAVAEMREACESEKSQRHMEKKMPFNHPAFDGVKAHVLRNTQPAAMPTEPHPDDIAVDRFAAELKVKLASSRDKGRCGWETCPPEVLSRMLREHVEKGDPRDVANFAMFLWSLDKPIGAAPPTESVADISADVETVIGLLEDREWAEYCTKTKLGKRLEAAITEMHDQISEAQCGAMAETSSRDDKS